MVSKPSTISVAKVNVEHDFIWQEHHWIIVLVQKCNNSVLCGRVWVHSTVSYRCRTCAINPSMRYSLEPKHLSTIYYSSLCPDCFYAGNHVEHDVNMFRSLGGGVCDCGDGTVMKCDGFCKHHGPNRISDGRVLVKYIRSAQIVLPRLITIFLLF